MTRIGLAWSGYAGYRNDRDHSIALRRLEPLLRLDFEFHSLQHEVRPNDLAALTEFTQIRSHQDELKDFSDTAALLSELDLVITVDTSVATSPAPWARPRGSCCPRARTGAG